MELSQQFLIDMALNAGGYVLAGALGVVIYSLFNRRKVAVAQVTQESQQDMTETAEENEVVENPARRLEFIKLGSTTEPTQTTSRPDVAEAAQAVAGRRDRADIIRVARTMLKAGATHDKIKRVIPISDAELSLLAMSKS